MTGMQACMICERQGLQWCPMHGPMANDPQGRMLTNSMLAALIVHDRAKADEQALTAALSKDIYPTNGRVTGAILDATNTEGNQATVMAIEYDARPFEGCQGLALLHWRVRDQATSAPNTRHNSKVMLTVVCGTGAAEIRYPLIDATKGGRISIPGAGAVQVTAFIAAANAAAFVLARTVTIEAAVSWGGGSRVPAYQTLPALTLAANVPSAFVEIPDQAHFAMAGTTNPGRAAALQIDFATDAFAADIRYSELAPNLNSTLIHSGVNFIRLTGDAIQDVTPIFETN